MKVTINNSSGFCFGVVYAIEMAESILKDDGVLYCLGDIVHNNKEVDRLHNMGLKVIEHNDLLNLRDCKVLIRAHGEPPETYNIALKNNIELLDASCPIVLKLQHQIKAGYEEIKKIEGQVVIFGKEGHAEVVGLLGQTDNKAILVASIKDLDKVDFSKSIYMYSQTTKSPKAYAEITAEIEKRVKFSTNAEIKYIANDTLCRQVTGRERQLKSFAQTNDVIVFVSGKKSSNGKFLYSSCKKQNKRSYFISDVDELDTDWFLDAKSVGICGATSTPRWLMEEVKQMITKIV
ncbi:MAG: 4-hydroxy-3-methylbut-2-enyl diphosphate reductase [Flavobacteriales bacterium]|nr:4-hydroxy-3-methylbut-2-enyl diphosphate reductase [Flavobacteriales bacterium]|tara:strand:- start:15294 stop:16166 length:873 start_codon:yes stop_codon:yes gene_type:complete